MERIKLANILTEQRNSNSRHLEQKTVEEILTIINNDDATLATAIKKEIPKISKAIELIVPKILNQNGRLIYLGAGSSGRMGVLDASEMLPTYGVKDKIIGLIAGGDQALRLPIEGAEDKKEFAIVDLKTINLNQNDVVLVIGASGRTPYCIGALEYAKVIGALPLALCMTNNAEFEKYADITLNVISGPEIVTGSTRMKAGTATKMVLNMISTTIMIKMGKVYDNLMIDVRASNEKLISRCVNIVSELVTTTDEQKIIDALKKADYNCKLAIVMLEKNIDVNQAKDLLLKNNDNLGETLK
ncbi:N-acetylmuramic acid 6-phosphate etherase [Spiroplasma endosymbiont of Labia minor]|uniref:N-acetylmuramic acid 6-phosphate etherase n=1 Tax=Spiroplasma endosymbiont of Labia minor TaxID=3066305 RepID=UPI0030D4E020